MISLHRYHLLSPTSHVLQRGTSRCWCQPTRTTQLRSQTGCRCTPVPLSSEYYYGNYQPFSSLINLPVVFSIKMLENAHYDLLKANMSSNPLFCLNNFPKKSVYYHINYQIITRSRNYNTFDICA